MKKPIFLFPWKLVLFSASFFFIGDAFAQTSKESNVIIVACKKGMLVIDGAVIGPVEKDDATKQLLSFGEHYIQLKTDTEKLNLTLNVDGDTKGIFKIGCDIAKYQATRLIDKQLGLTGSIINNKEENVIGLDKGDKIILNCSVLNKKGNATISIKEYNNGVEIYKKERFKEIVNEEILIPSKGIYFVSLHTDALFGKEAKVTIDRLASSDSDPSFSTLVKTVNDTTSIEVLNTIIRVYSATNLDHVNRTSVRINLPQNTTYWAYWIGVGQEAQNQMKAFTSSIASIGSYLPLNPLIKYGMKVISSLPMLNSTATISYRFVDSQNAQFFVNKQGYKYFTFKHSENICTDYSLIGQNFQDLVLAMNNESTFTGQDVEVRVVAFIVTNKLVFDN